MMSQPEMVVWAVAALAGLSFGSTVALWLIKRELARIINVVDRIPPKSWFDRVERSLPDIRQLEAHYQRVQEHAGKLTEHEFRIRAVEKTQQ